MPINEYTCPKCKFYYDTPNHQIGCETVTPKVTPVFDNYQIPKVDPEENWKEYSAYLEDKDGNLDLQKVKELAAHTEWARQNNHALLTADLQYEFSKPHTHASWVAAAIRRSFYDEKMYEVEELIEIMEGGGLVGEEDLIETVKNYFDYDEWMEDRR